MTKIKLLFPYSGLFFLLVMATVNLASPANSYAIEITEGDSLALSITPTAEPPQPTVEPPQPTVEPPQPTVEPPQPTAEPPSEDISNDDGGSDDDNDDMISTVQVQIGSCGLTCEIETPLQVAGKVQLVHEGTNFIVEGELNNSTNQQFHLPYSGKWLVFMTELFTPPLDDNISVQLPVALGSVESNVSTVQLVSCPINCSIDTSNFQTLPPEILLPVTGTIDDKLFYDWVELGLASSLLLVLIIGTVAIMLRDEE